MVLTTEGNPLDFWGDGGWNPASFKNNLSIDLEHPLVTLLACFLGSFPLNSNSTCNANRNCGNFPNVTFIL